MELGYGLSQSEHEETLALVNLSCICPRVFCPFRVPLTRLMVLVVEFGSDDP